ncbi:hypothetical protein [Kineosporia succinea]|uniref:Uncharacterized protein n=1 Tax=Kineosporia succinea TaxID=84632 RepID=A0ABT9NXQ9_9ACTN|nr:hypothetical protein [Kineosporia succinea]MDP9825207.1 hypothetical protein [Kineosporia succinea]
MTESSKPGGAEFFVPAEVERLVRQYADHSGLSAQEEIGRAVRVLSAVHSLSYKETYWLRKWHESEAARLNAGQGPLDYEYLYELAERIDAEPDKPAGD